jgi:hypothetical protein
MDNPQVLVVGAGPVGLTLALDLDTTCAGCAMATIAARSPNQVLIGRLPHV